MCVRGPCPATVGFTKEDTLPQDRGVSGLLARRQTPHHPTLLSRPGRMTNVGSAPIPSEMSGIVAPTRERGDQFRANVATTGQLITTPTA